MAAHSLGEDREFAYRRLIELGIALSAERNHDRLLEMILLGAKELANADGGTLYLVSEAGRELRFEIAGDTVDRPGGTTGAPIPFPPVLLQDPDGTPNYKSVVAAAATTGQTINLADAYNAPGFDFSGPRAFDARTGYRSQSFLTVPLTNHEAEVVGVLQLINAQSPEAHTIAFPAEIMPLVEALASQAAVALDNQMLIAAQDLFRSVLKIFDGAIDAKSPYTGGHCHRVPEPTCWPARPMPSRTARSRIFA
jgi:GAF domain-containing protein